MKSFSKKSEELKNLKDKLPNSKITVFTSFSGGDAKGPALSSSKGSKGLSVTQMQELKRGLRELNSEYVVTKKTLIDRALKSMKKETNSVLDMDGSIGLALGGDDPYAISKKLYEFSKKNTALKFWGALTEDGFIDTEKFMEMAKMPSREALIGGLLAMMKYPIMGLTVVLGEVAKSKS
jgi:large subunit ribosomal protein L10